MTSTASDDHPPERTVLLAAVDLSSPLISPTSFTLQAGECLGVSGESGAGKTRLLRLLADLDAGSGSVFLNGVSRAAIPAPQWRRQVIYQSAEPTWWKSTLREHFSAEQLLLVKTLMDELALEEDRLDKELSLLSTGERQRASLIRSLLAQPLVLLLDEPTSALDRANTGRVENLLLQRLQAGMAILLVTHAEEQLQRLAHRHLTVTKRR